MQFPPVYLLTPLLLLTPRAALTAPTVHDAATDITYTGTESNGIEHFQNIKYAHSTSGHRRFAPPDPYLPPRGSDVDATTRGPACPQDRAALPPFFAPEPDLSEDCLSLRIARPAGLNLSATSRLPVLVWLHGGGVVKGSAYDPHSDPDALLHQSLANDQPVLFAAFNFRLSLFGFASSPALRAAHSENAGLRDQRAAFEWLKAHVAAFGGDPDRLTAFGLSAGGTFLALHHVAFGGARGAPFDRAFMMSGPPGTAVNQLSDEGAAHTRSVAARLDCATDDDAALLACLRAQPMDALLTAATAHATQHHPPNGLFTFIPRADGDILPDRPTKLMRAGRFAKRIPAILGWTMDDGALNAGPAALYAGEDAIRTPLGLFFPHLHEEHIQRLLALYSAADFAGDARAYNARRAHDAPEAPVHWFRAARLLRDMLFTCSAMDFAHQAVKHAPAATGADEEFRDVYVYALNQSTLNPIWDAVGFDYVGASHGSDQNYVFNGVFPEGRLTKADRRLAAEFSSSVIHFAYTGRPVSAERFSQTFDRWPQACSEYNRDGDEWPDVNVQLIGGPHGTAAFRVGQDAVEPVEEHATLQQRQGFQSVLGDMLSYGSMSGHSENPASLLQGEKLHQRCSYILSLGEFLQN